MDIASSEAMKPLEPGQLHVMRIRAVVAAVLLGLAALAAELYLLPRFDIPRGLAAGPALLLVPWMVLVSPARRFRAWRYAMDEEDLRLRWGVWTETWTLVPLDRVQHIDVSQGPIERAFGLCRLIVHTAGSHHGVVVLPGLTRADAERMRDEIRARIAREPE